MIKRENNEKKNEVTQVIDNEGRKDVFLRETQTLICLEKCQRESGTTNQPSLLDEAPLRGDAVHFEAHLSPETRLSNLSGLCRVLKTKEKHTYKTNVSTLCS